MKYTVDSFLDALENRMDELKDTTITSSSDIGSQFSEDDLQQFDSLKEEAFALNDDENDAIDFLYNRLADKGYSDDEITQILDYEGL